LDTVTNLINANDIIYQEPYNKVYLLKNLSNYSLTEFTKKEVERLIVEIQRTLQEAIAAGGSSLKDYVNTSGEVGYFQNKHHVYGKANQSCDVCSSVIMNIRQSGRSTFYCSSCQR
jgi:formamidopyrimidine-DNA glycosylase